MSIEVKEDIGSSALDKARYWRLELEAASKEEEDYRKRADELVDMYKQGEKSGKAFNILWANTETLKPAIYSHVPVPDVRRRFKDKDPTGRAVAELIERALKYCIESYDFDSAIEQVRDDMLLTGRGVPWVSYEPVITKREEESLIINEAGEIETVTQEVEELTEQKLITEYIFYKDYRQSPAKCEKEVRWKARLHRPTRQELVDQFGEKGWEVKLMQTLPEELQKDEGAENEMFMRAKVWEIWDKAERKRIWYAEGYNKLLEEEDDPYGLEGFFPCPQGAYSFKIIGSTVPVAEYNVYEEQAKIVNLTSVRIEEITEHIQAKGITNDVSGNVEKLSSAKNGDIVVAEALDPNIDISRAIAWWPVEQIAKALIALYQAREQAMAVIQQITGIADIVRGSTKASETATAQQLKGNFASLRLTPRQQSIQRVIRDCLRIKAEIIAEQFDPDVLSQMTGLQVTPEMLAIMRSNKLRGYRIDVETDSTVQPDAEAEKQQRIEFLTAVSGFLQQIIPAVQAGYLQPEVAKAMIGFGTRAFKVGRELEDAIDSIGDQQPQQQGPTPEQQIEAGRLELDQREQALKERIEPAKVQIDAFNAKVDAMSKLNPMSRVQ